MAGVAVADLVGPAVEEVNGAVRDVLASQTALGEQLGALGGLLEGFVGDHPEAPALSGHLDKLAQARERMDRITAMMLKIQTRLERLERE